MKKLIILCLFLISVPAFALCSIESGESICSISNPNNSNSMPIFKSPNAASNINNSASNFNSYRQNTKLNNQLREQNSSIMKYNSGCQFGTCVQDVNNANESNQ